jgi:endonuclease/exonuclease/phosphatase family metal-dependent hydrolase
MLYHFPNLHVQFPYLEAENLTHKDRIGRTVRVLNGLEADVSCHVEWNGNDLNPYQIDHPDVLMERLNTAIGDAIGTFKDNEAVTKFLEEIKKIAEVKKVSDMKAINEMIEEEIKNQRKVAEPNADLITELQALADRAETVTHAKDLYFYQEPQKWALKVAQKKSGKVVEKGKPTEQTFEAKKPKNADTTKQSILMIINRERFEPFDDTYGIYTDAPDKPGEPNSQNFITKTLTLKGTSIKIEVICTHMKSKYPMFLTRRKLGQTISQYVEERKKTPEGKKTNFILMGDMNTEIEEFSFDLNANIVRLEPQSQLPATSFEPRAIFTPLSQVKDINKRIEKEEEILPAYNEYLEKYKQLAKTVEGASTRTSEIDELKKALAETDKKALAETEKTALAETEKTTPATPRLLWFETANFPTEKKIRVKEIDYLNESYQKYLNAYLNANPQVKQEVEEAEESYKEELKQKRNKKFDELKIKHAELKDVKERIPEFQEKDKDTRDLRAVEFKAVLQHLRNVMDRNHETNKYVVQSEIQWERNNKSLMTFFNRLVNSLLHEEKIDFVLLQPYNDFEMIKARSVDSFETDRTVGVPNKDFPSDHFPTWVEINFFEKQFDEKGFIDSHLGLFAVKTNELGYHGHQHKKLKLV